MGGTQDFTKGAGRKKAGGSCEKGTRAVQEKSAVGKVCGSAKMLLSPSMRKGKTSTNGNLCPAFTQKIRGQRANCLLFCHNDVF